MGPLRKSKTQPSEGREQALRHLKHMIRDRMDSTNISIDQFSAVLQEEKCKTCDVFQQLVFSECNGCRKLADIEQCLSRYRALFASTSLYEARDFSLMGKVTPLYLASDCLEVYSVKEVVFLLLEMLIVDLYLYLSRYFNSRRSMLKSLKLLRSKYSDELKWMINLEKRCVKVFGGKEDLNASEFRRVIDYQKELSDKIFNKFDQSRSGALNRHELYDGLVGILTANTAGRLRYLFDIYDTDGNGMLNRDEVYDVLNMCICESRLQFHNDLVLELSNVFWGKITNWQRDSITFEEFYDTLREYPSVYNNLSINVIGSGNFDGMFRFLEKKKKAGQLAGIVGESKQSCLRFGTRFISNRTLWFTMALYFCITVGLLAERLYRLLPRPMEEGWYVVAKCAGQLLNFNIAFSLLLTLKHVYTRLRKVAGLRRFLPFDDAQFLHKLVAYFICFLCIIHIGAHASFIVVKLTFMEGVSQHYFMEGDACVVFWTGVALIPILMVFIFTSLPTIKNYSYELFMRSHQIAAVLWLGCLVAHASNFWKWILLPASVVLAERLFFLVLLFVNKTTVDQGIVHDNITQLIIKRPRFFKFSPGDYVNVNIPEISKSQWHPFTISSCPDPNSDCFTLHIRKVGNWTGKLHTVIKEKNEDLKSLDNKCFDTDTDENSPVTVKKFSDDMSTFPAKFPSTKNCRTSTLERQPPVIIEMEGDSEASSSDESSSKSSNDASDNPEPKPFTNNNNHGLTLVLSVPKHEVLESCTAFTVSPVSTRNTLDLTPTSLIDSPSTPISQTASPRIFTSQSSRELRCVTPVERRMLKHSNSSDTLNSISDSRRSSLANARQSRSLSVFSRESSRSSIIAIPVDEAACLDWQVYLDGPYSTPSHTVLNTKHAILVAGGIGITPFASVLESIIHLMKGRARCSGSCGCLTSSQGRRTLCRKHTSLERIDFFWVTRDQSYLSWFHQVFRDIELAQAALGLNPPLVNLHIYLTGLKSTRDIRGTFLQLALEMIYQEDSLDVLSGLQAQTKAGRPVWSEVLSEITTSDSSSAEKKSRPKLFACGPSGLCDQLKQECYKMDIAFKEEVF